MLRDRPFLHHGPQPIDGRPDGREGEKHLALEALHALEHLREDRGPRGLVEEHEVDGGACKIEAVLVARLKTHDGAVLVPGRRLVGVEPVDRVILAVVYEVAPGDVPELLLDGQGLRPRAAHHPGLEPGALRPRGDRPERVPPERLVVDLCQTGPSLPHLVPCPEQLDGRRVGKEGRLDGEPGYPGQRVFLAGLDDGAHLGKRLVSRHGHAAPSIARRSAGGREARRRASSAAAAAASTDRPSEAGALSA